MEIDDMHTCNVTPWAISLFFNFWITSLFILELVRYINQFYKIPKGQWSSFWMYADFVFSKIKGNIHPTFYRISVVLILPPMFFFLYFLASPFTLLSLFGNSLLGNILMILILYFAELSLLGLFYIQEFYILKLNPILQIVLLTCLALMIFACYKLSLYYGPC